MKVFFTDLDGTLLDPETYSWQAASPALELIQSFGYALVFCSSKTRAEVELWRSRLDNHHPFVVENGGAVYVPKGYFPFAIPGSVAREGYHVIELGDPYPSLVEALRRAAERSRCRVRAFHDMSLADICVRSLLPVAEAKLAQRREFDEPFEILDRRRSSKLLHAIEEQGKRWTRGGVFYHITGHNDKARAVLSLISFYRRKYSEVVTLGLGDGPNDAPFLRVVDIPILVRSRFLAQLKERVPHGMVTAESGPRGWNQAVLERCSEDAAVTK